MDDDDSGYLQQRGTSLPNALAPTGRTRAMYAHARTSVRARTPIVPARMPCSAMHRRTTAALAEELGRFDLGCLRFGRCKFR